MQIAVLSDTHGLFRKDAAQIIEPNDAVIHGGVIKSQKLLDEIKSVMKPSAQLFVVRGNNNKEWAEYLPEYLKFELSGMKFALIYNKRNLPLQVNADIIIFGHTHKYFRDFTRQIAMICATHPCVTAEGIMNKMEVNTTISHYK